MDNNNKLTAKQQRFVAAYSTGIPAKTAVIQAGYNVTTDASASSLAYKLLNKEGIQSALREAIAHEFVNAPKITAQTIIGVMQSQTNTDSEKLKAVHLICKIFGWYQTPQSLSVDVSVRDTFKLPEE